MTKGSLNIEAERPDQPDVVAMLRASDAYMDGLYPPKNNYMLDVADLMVREITFLVARRDGVALGCAALARREGYAEIKRMWVSPSARGAGLAGRLLARLEEIAREFGWKKVRLDTNRALAEAQAMYRKAGYRAIARYNANPYADFWFEKAL